MDALTHQIPAILLAYTVFVLTIVSPGPNNLAVIGASMGSSRVAGVALGMGVTTGSFCWAAMTAMGLSALLASSTGALTLIKVLGGVYLLWLAYRAFRAATATGEMRANKISNATLRACYVRGFLIQMTNPKAALTWIAIISLGLGANTSPWVAVVIVLGTTLLAAVIHTAYAVSFSTAPAIRFYNKARAPIQFVMGACFGFAGIKLLTGRL